MSQAWNAIINLKGAQGIQGVPGADGISFVWLGTWVSSTAYALNQVVARLGSTYICIVANTNVDPNTDGGTHWALMAQAGSTGSPGTTGGTGPAGTRGSIFQPSVANIAALPALPAAGYSVGDMLITGDGNLCQITGP